MRTRTFWMMVPGGFAVVMAGVLFLGLEPSRQTSGAAAPTKLACRFLPEEQLEFRVRAVADTKAGSSSGDTHQVLGARMKWRVLREDGKGSWLVAAALGSVELVDASITDPAYRSSLEEPFLFHVGQDCGFHGFAFRPTTAPRAQARMQSLLQSFELRLPTPPTPSFWTASHEDGLGQYTVLYRRTGVSEQEEPMLSKTRGPYTRITSPAAGAFKAAVEGSVSELVLDRQGRWLQRMEGSEQLTLSASGNMLVSTRQQLELQRVEAEGPFPTNLDPAAFVSSNPVAEQKYEPPPPDPRLRDMSLADVLEEITSLLMKQDRPAHDIADVLAQYLRIHPEMASQLLTELRTGKHSDRVHALAFLALEMAGTVEAQKALVTAMQDRALGTMDRMRAAVALPDVQTPSRDSVDALIDTARRLRQTGGTEEEQVASTALRAVGALSRRVEATQPELAQLARTEIRDELAVARGMNEVTSALDAVGNTGDEGLSGELARFQQDDSSVVRSRAALAYRRMEPETATPALADWLAKEKDGTVRQSIIDAMLQVSQAAGGAPASEYIIATATTQLAQETNPRTRELLIQLLGSAARTSPQARATLAMHFHRETEPQLLILLGRYIGPEDLR
ncbi:hypothetical protein [Hyalangium versicolor]|uniref:hypothetical protein n=1 Tax=Hyalangium versicolor TaxID=2861190 RepID=UPI001CCFBD90|nr:hypothetical protein [Hyalangium versicolor]